MSLATGGYPRVGEHSIKESVSVIVTPALPSLQVAWYVSGTKPATVVRAWTVAGG